MKEILIFLEIIFYFIICFYLFYKIQWVFQNEKFKKIDKNKYRLLKSTNNKKFKMEFFENGKWQEMDNSDSISVFFLFKNLQEEVNAKSMFNRFVGYYENKEKNYNEKEDKELEYKIVE